MSQIYNISYTRLINLLLPTFLRKPNLIALLRAMLAPVMRMYSDFMSYRLDTDYSLGVNSQVVHLQRALNDQFDSSSRRIRIEDGNRLDRLFIYIPVENKPKFLGKIHLNRREDFADTGIDFIVKLNGVSLTGTQRNAMDALLRRYKLATKTYSII